MTVSKEITNSVTFARYYRRWSFVHNQIESRGGLTCLCTLNFVDSTISVYPAFCSDEEVFDKSTGRHVANIAYNNKHGIIIDHDPELSIFENLTKAIHDKDYMFISDDTDVNKRITRGFNNCMKSAFLGSILLVSPILFYQ